MECALVGAPLREEIESHSNNDSSAAGTPKAAWRWLTHKE